MAASRASAKKLAQRDHAEPQRRREGEKEADDAQAFAAREQILDQMRDTEPEAEQHKAYDAGTRNTVPQPKARRGTAGAATGTGSCAASGSGVICTVPRAGLPDSSASMTVYARIVEGPSCSGPPMFRSIVHCSRSPIRNCSARSRRM